MISLILRVAAVAFGLTIIQILFSMLGNQVIGAAPFGWMLLSNLLIVLVMTWSVLRSSGSGLRVTMALTLFYFGIHLNNLIEAVLFQLSISREELIGMILSSFVVAILFAPFLVWVLGRWGSAASMESASIRKISKVGMAWRVIACVLVYVFLYLVAGMIIFPYVQDFYRERALPPILHVLGMQIFRGLVFVALSLMIMGRLRAKQWEMAMISGLLLSIVGGIAPLLVPSPYLPAHVRWVHIWEVGTSNFLFGAFIGWVFGKSGS